MARFLPSLRRTQPKPETKDAVSRRHSTGGTYVWPGAPVQPPLGDLDIDRAVNDGWKRGVWVYRCIDARAKNLANLRQVVATGREEGATEIDNHPLTLLLNRRANPYETAYQFRYRFHTLADLSTKGVFVEVIENRRGDVGALHLLHPKFTFPIADPDQFVEGFEFRNPSGETTTLPKYEQGQGGVLWYRRPHPTDPYMSSTWVESAGISIDIDHYARLFNRNFMLNDGKPGGVLVVDGGEEGIDDETAAGLVARTRKGPENAGMISVVEADGIDYVDFSTTPRDAQYVEGRAITKAEILAAAGTPESVFNASGRTYDNADAELEGWWMHELQPEANLVASVWEELTPGGIMDDSEVVTYAWEEVPYLKRQQKEREDRAASDFINGLISVDEYRQITKKDALDLPGTRVLWLASGKAPVGSEEDVAAILGQGQAPPGEEPPPGGSPALPPGSPPEGGAPAIEGPTESEDPIGDLLLAEAKALSPPKDVKTGKEGDPLAGHRAAQAALVDKYATQLQDEILALFRRQERVISARLGGSKARKHTRHWVTEGSSNHELKKLDAGYIVDRRRWIDEVVKAIADIVRAAFTGSGTYLVDQFDGDTEFDGGDKADEIVAQTVRIIAEGFDARAGQLQKIVTDADEAGKSMDEIGQKVKDAFLSVDTWAEVTSRQVVGAMNAAQQIGAAQVGATKKRWLATEDERTRPTHVKAEGQVVDLDGKFNVGEGKLSFPGDPTGPVGEWINCRCTMLFQSPERDFDAELDEDLAALDALEGKALAHRVAGFAAGFATPNLVFDPDEHPRDHRGRFVDTPDIALPGIGVGVAVAANDDGSITVAMPDGRVIEDVATAKTDPPDTSPGGIRRAAASQWAAEAGIADWETTQPWNASRADIEAGKVPGIRYDRDAVRGFTAHWSHDPTGIVVNDTFFDGTPESLRSLLYHEAGHAVASEMVAGRDVNDVLGDFRAESGRGFVSPFGEGMTGSSTGHGMHHNEPTEILADAYAALADGTAGYYHGDTVDSLFARTAEVAGRLGFPVGARDATPREVFDEWRDTEDDLWERRPSAVHGSRIKREGRGKYRWYVHAGTRDDGTERNDTGVATTLAKAKVAADASYSRLVPPDDMVSPNAAPDDVPVDVIAATESPDLTSPNSVYALHGELAEVPKDVADRGSEAVDEWMLANTAADFQAHLADVTEDDDDFSLYDDEPPDLTSPHLVPGDDDHNMLWSNLPTPPTPKVGDTFMTQIGPAVLTDDGYRVRVNLNGVPRDFEVTLPEDPQDNRPRGTVRMLPGRATPTTVDRRQFHPADHHRDAFGDFDEPPLVRWGDTTGIATGVNNDGSVRVMSAAGEGTVPVAELTEVTESRFDRPDMLDKVPGEVFDTPSIQHKPLDDVDAPEEEPTLVSANALPETYARGDTPWFGTGGIGTDTIDKRLGSCYDLSVEALFKGAPAGSHVVFGTIQGDGNPPLGHAWLELPDGDLWEPITHRVYAPDEFAMNYAGIERARYDKKAAATEALAAEHYGPWYETDEAGVPVDDPPTLAEHEAVRAEAARRIADELTSPNVAPDDRIVDMEQGDGYTIARGAFTTYGQYGYPARPIVLTPDDGDPVHGFVEEPDGRILETCGKCGGSGHLPEYGHVHAGVCFQCQGYGVTKGFDDAKSALKAIKRRRADRARRARKREEAAAERVAEFEAWKVEHADILARLAPHAAEREGQWSRIADELHMHALEVDRGMTVPLVTVEDLLDARDAELVEQNATAAKARHAGEVGDKVGVEGIVRVAKYLEPQNYGWSASMFLIIEGIGDSDGITIKTTGSGKTLFGLGRGDKVFIEGAIKNNDTYEGLPQSQLTRSKVTVVEKAPDPDESPDLTSPRLDDPGGLHGALSVIAHAVAEAWDTLHVRDQPKGGEYETLLVLEPHPRAGELPKPLKYRANPRAELELAANAPAITLGVSRQARANIPTLKELAATMSGDDAIAEWRRLYTEEKLRLHRARDTDEETVQKRVVGDILAAQAAIENANLDVPTAIYGLDEDAAVAVSQSGASAPGAGYLPNHRTVAPDGKERTWSTIATKLNEGDVVPIHDITIQKMKVVRGFATKRNGMPMLVGTLPSEGPDVAERRFQQMEDTWAAATKDVSPEQVGQTSGLAWVQQPKLTGIVGFPNAMATAGDGNITMWVYPPDVHTYRHEMGHNVDTHGARPGLTRENEKDEWKDAVAADAAPFTAMSPVFRDDSPIELNVYYQDHPLVFTEPENPELSGPTKYGRKNQVEHYAESVAWYIKDRQHGKLGLVTPEPEAGLGDDVYEYGFADLYPARARYFDGIFGNDPAPLSELGAQRLAREVGTKGPLSEWSTAQLQAEMRAQGLDPSGMSDEQMLAALYGIPGMDLFGDDGEFQEIAANGAPRMSLVEAMPEEFQYNHSLSTFGTPFRIAMYEPGAGVDEGSSYYRDRPDLVGFVDAYRDDNDNVNIGFVSTRRGYERQGIATALIEEATKDAPEVDFGHIMHNGAGAIVQRMLDAGRTVHWKGPLVYP